MMLNKITGALQGVNDVAKREAEVRQLSAQLSGMGIAPTEDAYFDSGDSVTKMGKTYSSDMLNWMRNMNASFEAENQITAQRMREEEKIIADGRKAITEALKDTPAAKIAGLQQERDAALEAVKKQIEVYKEQGVATGDLEKNLFQITSAYDKKVADINNKGAKSAIAPAKAENGYAAAVAETTAQIAGYQQQLSFDKSESLGRAKAKIESEYQQAVAKTTKEIENQVVAKRLLHQKATR